MDEQKSRRKAVTQFFRDVSLCRLNTGCQFTNDFNVCMVVCLFVCLFVCSLFALWVGVHGWMDGWMEDSILTYNYKQLITEF